MRDESRDVGHSGTFSADNSAVRGGVKINLWCAEKKNTTHEISGLNCREQIQYQSRRHTATAARLAARPAAPPPPRGVTADGRHSEHVRVSRRVRPRPRRGHPDVQLQRQTGRAKRDEIVSAPESVRACGRACVRASAWWAKMNKGLLSSPTMRLWGRSATERAEPCPARPGGHRGGCDKFPPLIPVPFHFRRQRQRGRHAAFKGRRTCPARPAAAARQARAQREPPWPGRRRAGLRANNGSAPVRAEACRGRDVACRV